MLPTYETEREGQLAFFKNYGIDVASDNSILVDNTDGVYNGNLFEFKLSIGNLNRVLFQAIKYCSRMRIKGESVPATILLVDLNHTTVYVYRSEDYFDEIHQVYYGGASKDNEGFSAGPYKEKLYYSDMQDAAKVRKLLKGKKTKAEKYLRIRIDENCIVGWAERYYRENPTASKGDFLGDDTGTKVKVTGEIRDPKHFPYEILPYTEPTNEKFKYLMDCLNDRLQKKDLGAFYTPAPYAEKAAELVLMAVDRVPDGNDYIILDRCAGCGALEAALIGLRDKHGSELISHCVVSTYEYYEYKVLMERIGDRVREIVPPSEANVVYANGKVSNADAMSEEYIKNPIIRQYVDDENCTIILFENPPYQDSTAITFADDDGKRGKSLRTGSFVNMEYRKISDTLNEGKASAREISNLFIWSAFAYYLRHPTDSYIVFSPVKYFKNVGLAQKRFEKGFLFNIRHFHATDSSISCILWSNIDDKVTEQFLLSAYDINKETDCVEYIQDVLICKAHNTLVEFYDKRTFPDDVEENKVWVTDSGYEVINQKIDTKQIMNKNIIGILGAKAFAIDVKSRILVRGPGYYHHGVVFILRNDNYLQKLPLWVAKMFPQDNWYEKDVYNTTSDGGDAYTKDANFLKACLIYTCLSNQNKCLTFDGSDGRHYQNELCFDNSATLWHTPPILSDLEALPLALQDLNRYGMKKETVLDEDEKQLLRVWNKILEEARQTANYNPSFTYGVYQITKELNTFVKTGSGSRKRIVYDYPELNGDLDTLRVMLKTYYKSHITEKMFQYELLK